MKENNYYNKKVEELYKEFDENTKNPLIHIMEEQKGIYKKGGTMRLGSYPCVLKKGSLAERLYGKTEIKKIVCYTQKWRVS